MKVKRILRWFYHKCEFDYDNPILHDNWRETTIHTTFKCKYCNLGTFMDKDGNMIKENKLSWQISETEAKDTRLLLNAAKNSNRIDEFDNALTDDLIIRCKRINKLLDEQLIK